MAQRNEGVGLTADWRGGMGMMLSCTIRNILWNVMKLEERLEYHGQDRKL